MTMDEKLILKDGTELHGHQIETEVRLFLYVFDLTLAEVFQLLIDPEKTKSITWERYGNTGKVTGYKRLMSISDENTMICASLKKG